MLTIKNLNSTHYFLVSEAYLEINRTSKLEPFANIPNGLKPSTDFAESSVFDVRLGSESSEYNSYKNFDSIKLVEVWSFRPKFHFDSKGPLNNLSNGT